jgi:hypothetical protein
MNQLDKRPTVETPALSNLTISILRVVRSKFARYSWGISLRGLYGTRAGKGSQLIGFPCANQLRFIAPMAQLPFYVCPVGAMATAVIHWGLQLLTLSCLNLPLTAGGARVIALDL